MRALIGVLLALVALSGLGAKARAQDNLGGTWQAGATTIDWKLESWGPDCGPEPQSMRSGGGGRVQLEQSGDLLIIHGRDRDVRSDRCWGENPALKKVGTSHNSSTWITRCKTASSDPRQEHATYTLRLEATDRLLYEDVSHFDWKLKASTCVATTTTRQTFQRVVAAAPPAPSPPATAGQKPPVSGAVPGISSMPSTPPPGSRGPTVPPPGAKPQPPICVPGKPAHLTLRPKRAAIELGQRTCFEAKVTDAKGCEAPQAAISWSLEHRPGIRAQLEGGCFRAESGSADGEGAFKVLVASSGLRASAKVDVSASTLPALIARRLESGAIAGETPDAGEPAAVVAAAPTPAIPVEARQPAARVVAHTVAVPHDDDRRSLRLAALVVGVLACAFAFLMWRLRRPAQVRRTSVPSEPPEPSAAVRSLRCPRCGAFYPAGSAFCGNDGSALEPR